MNLVSVNVEEFHDRIYPEYKKLFSKEERKPYQAIIKAMKQQLGNVIKILENDVFIGFIIVNTLENNPYVQLDYLAILPEYQSRGYGKKVISLLRNHYHQYKGIFIEIEKIGLGKNEEENQIRMRRKRFYENAGFQKLGFDLDLYHVIYSAYLLPCLEKEISETDIIESIFQIYNALLGEKNIKKFCKLMILNEE